MDAKVRTKLRTEIRAIQKQLGITTIMVTHDQEEALTMADRVIVMNNAVVEQTGSPKEIYSKPSTHFVAGFIGTMNFFNSNEGTQAIRPEKIKVVGYHDSYDKVMPITSFEFKGPLTRIYGQAYGEPEICIELPTHEFEPMQLREGAPVYMQFPKEHMSHYEETAVDVA